MPEIRIPSQKKKIFFEPKQSLMRILVDAGVYIENPCMGKGICGKCKVQMQEKTDVPLSSQELRFLKPEEVKNGVRLACFLYPDQNMTLEPVRQEKKSIVLTQGRTAAFSFCPEVVKKSISIEKSPDKNSASIEEQIIGQLGIQSPDLSRLRQNRWDPGDYRAVLYRDRLLCLEKREKPGTLFGVAVDIGTTTVAAALVDLETGREYETSAALNGQSIYGLDVLTRIAYERENPDKGISHMQHAIVSVLEELILNMCRNNQVPPDAIYEVAVSANCTMLHMLAGVSAVSMGVSPYTPVFRRSRYLRSETVGLGALKNAYLYLMPSVSAYVGADLVSGIHACGLEDTDRCVLFIDIGTNGELALVKEGRILSCSCAAGPALEGMNISAGMRAGAGAVEDVTIHSGSIRLSVIHGGRAEGLCGSGILAAVRELLKVGMIDPGGAVRKPEELDPGDYRARFICREGKKRRIVLAENISITQSDIRQVQLAKGAILSGIYGLLDAAGITASHVEEVLIAGQFGAYLPAESLTGTGIIPPELHHRITYVGNSSKTGAYMALMSAHEKRSMERLADRIEYLELSELPGYERLFSKCLQFPAFLQ